MDEHKKELIEHTPSSHLMQIWSMSPTELKNYFKKLTQEQVDSNKEQERESL